MHTLCTCNHLHIFLDFFLSKGFAVYRLLSQVSVQLCMVQANVAILSPFFESLALLRIKTKVPIASSYMGQHINIMLFSQSYAATLPFCENVVCHSTLFVVFELS